MMVGCLMKCLIFTICIVPCIRQTTAATHYITDVSGGLRKNDLIEWSGRANFARRPSFLVIKASKKTRFNDVRIYTLLRLSMMAARHKIVVKNGLSGREWSTRPTCVVGNTRIDRGKHFRMIIRVLPTSFMIYIGGRLVYVLPITSDLPAISEINHIAVYNARRTQKFRLLTDKDLGLELQDASCGRPSVDIKVPPFCPNPPAVDPNEIRIVGGKNAKPGKYPWQVSIRNRQIIRGRTPHSCGATLINSCYVLTAAHCVQSKIRSALDLITVRVGDYYNRDGHPYSQIETVEHSQDIEIERVFKHEAYAELPSPINDVALIKLRQCVSFGNFIRPACLPLGANQFSPATECGVTGWGAQSHNHMNPNDYPSCLQVAPVTIFPNQNCTNLLGNDFLSDSMLCAANEDSDTCWGDSGGPLMCQDPFSSRFTLWGITSWGIGCGNVQKPGIYTRVSSYVRWMYLKMKLHPLDEEFLDDVRSFRVLEHFCQSY